MGQENDKSVQPDLQSPGGSSEKVHNSQSDEAHNGGYPDGDSSSPPEEQKLLAPPAIPAEQRQLPPPAPPKTKPRWRNKLLWLAALALLVLAALVIYHFRSAAKENAASAKAKEQQAGAAITVGQSKTGNISIYVDALGTVTPLNTITLYSQITGQVTAAHYNKGQMVKQEIRLSISTLALTRAR